MRIKESHVVSGSDGIHTHLAGTITLWLILLYYLSPEHTCGTELRNLHEIVLGNTHVELYLRCRESRFYAGIYKLLQILVTPWQSITQLLYDISAAVAKSH